MNSVAKALENDAGTVVAVSPRAPLASEAGPPEPPETVIERHSDWRIADLRELWRYRELLYFLAWRDVKVRYKQTVLGAVWTVLQPLAMMAAFCLFLGRLAQGSEAIPHYALFVFAGIIPWNFFASAISSASQSVVASQNLVTKVYFPRLLIPTGAVVACLVDFAVTFVMLLVLMVYYRTPVGWGLCLVPLLVLALTCAALGLGILLAALTVAYRDFRHIVPFLVQIGMFATPSIYAQPEVLFPRWQWLLPLNPACGLIAGFRQAMLGGSFDLYSVTVSTAVSVCLLIGGCLYFRAVERGFADVI